MVIETGGVKMSTTTQTDEILNELIQEIMLLTPAERKELLEKWNNHYSK